MNIFFGVVAGIWKYFNKFSCSSLTFKDFSNEVLYASGLLHISDLKLSTWPHMATQPPLKKNGTFIRFANCYLSYSSFANSKAIPFLPRIVF